jgi:hypothetical protein
MEIVKLAEIVWKQIVCLAILENIYTNFNARLTFVLELGVLFWDLIKVFFFVSLLLNNHFLFSK